MYAMCVLSLGILYTLSAQWAALEGCTAALLMAGNDDAKQASGQCWRAYACAQCVPVARTACVRYASSSGRGQSEEQRAWTAWR